MSDRFKSCQLLLEAMEFGDDGMGWMPLSKDEVNTTIEALALAAEAEQIRKERDEANSHIEYLEKNHKIAISRLHDRLKKIYREKENLSKDVQYWREQLAKKVTENGNA